MIKKTNQDKDLNPAKGQTLIFDENVELCYPILIYSNIP